jgi:hypothetical protein
MDPDPDPGGPKRNTVANKSVYTVQEHTCPHDGWLFSFPENLRLHNKVAKLEQAAATQIEKRSTLQLIKVVDSCRRMLFLIFEQLFKKLKQKHCFFGSQILLVSHT